VPLVFTGLLGWGGFFGRLLGGQVQGYDNEFIDHETRWTNKQREASLSSVNYPCTHLLKYQCAEKRRSAGKRCISSRTMVAERCCSKRTTVARKPRVALWLYCIFLHNSRPANQRGNSVPYVEVQCSIPSIQGLGKFTLTNLLSADTRFVRSSEDT
jgi:hypothetical protein